jgi:anti-anti-sigma factor
MIGALVENGCLPQGGTTNAELVLDEALTNAIVHGNRQDTSLSVRVRLFADDERWGTIIEDEGEGFDRAQVPQVLGTESLLRETGRGIMLMDEYLDELVYNASGTKALLIRTREAELAEPHAPVPAAEPGSEAGEPVEVSESDGIAVAEITAESLFGDNSDVVRSALEQAAEGRRALVVDLHRVSYVSSVGLAVIVATYKLVRAHTGVMVLVGVQPPIMDMLTKSKLTGFFQFADDVEAAVKLAQELV